MKQFFEGLGKISGKQIVEPFINKLRKKIEGYDLEIVGEKNLQALKGKQYVLVSNHLKPTNTRMQQSGVSADAFVLEKLVKEINNQELRIVSKCDEGWRSENLYKYFQKYVQQPFGKGLNEGLGMIPVFKNPGSVNKSFLETVKKLVEQGQDPILIFPEGKWYDDFSSEHELEPGAAHIARTFNLSILPVYIKGARDLQPQTQVKVVFGEAFKPEKLNKTAITDKIRTKLTELQQSIKG